VFGVIEAPTANGGRLLADSTILGGLADCGSSPRGNYLVKMPAFRILSATSPIRALRSPGTGLHNVGHAIRPLMTDISTYQACAFRGVSSRRPPSLRAGGHLPPSGEG